MIKRITLLLAGSILVATPLYYFRFSIAGLPTNVLEVLIGLFVVSVLLKGGRLRFPYVLPVSVLLLGLVVGVAVSPDKSVALGIVKGWFVLPIAFGWAIANWYDESKQRFVFTALGINVLWVSLYAVLQWAGAIPLVGHQAVTPDLLQYIEQGRALAFFESPNYLGMYLVPLMLFVAVGWWHNRYVRWLVIIPFTAVVLSASRSALLALLVGLGLVSMYVLMQRYPRHKKQVLLASSVVLLAAVGLFLLLRVNIAGNDGLRLGVWRVAGDLISAHPFTGIGPGQFAHYFAQSQILPESLHQALLPYALHPHNLYLSLWLSGGVLALGGFTWVVLRCFQFAVAGVKQSRVLAVAGAVGLVTILVQGVVDSSYFKNDLALFFWLFAALVWQVSRVSVQPRRLHQRS